MGACASRQLEPQYTAGCFCRPLNRYTFRPSGHVTTCLYPNGDKWKASDSFGRDDLPLVAKVVDMPHTWIFQRIQDNV